LDAKRRELIPVVVSAPRPATRIETTRPEPLKDDLSREMFQDSSLRHRVHKEGLTSVTSNPAICNLAIAGNDWWHALDTHQVIESSAVN
jgi:hypothetical protein